MEKATQLLLTGQLLCEVGVEELTKVSPLPRLETGCTGPAERLVYLILPNFGPPLHRRGLKLVAEPGPLISPPGSFCSSKASWGSQMRKLEQMSTEAHLSTGLLTSFLHPARNQSEAFSALERLLALKLVRMFWEAGVRVLTQAGDQMSSSLSWVGCLAFLSIFHSI